MVDDIRLKLWSFSLAVRAFKLLALWPRETIPAECARDSLTIATGQTFYLFHMVFISLNVPDTVPRARSSRRKMPRSHWTRR
jgi:hypothetical protein